LRRKAVTLWTFQLAVVPGLLQTEEYARALERNGPAVVDEEEIEKRVRLRAERQRILTGDDPVMLFAVIDEAALRRRVVGEEVMRAQLEHLVRMAGQPGITLQVVPFEVGAHPDTAGAFTILSFGQGDPEAVFIETIGGELLLEEDADVKRCKALA
jgi:hypothetical protein